MMGKAPAFQFYVKDWLSDPELRLASASTRGIWIDLLCYMKWDTKQNGTLISDFWRFTRMLGISNDEFELFIDEAKRLNFCDISDIVTESNRVVTIINRRLLRESIDKENTRLRVMKHRLKRKSNKDVTVENRGSPSPSPSPSPKTLKGFDLFWEAYPKKKSKGQAEKTWKKIKPDKGLIDTILVKIEEAKKSEDWQKEGGQFIPYPSTWLNAKGWEDEYVETENDKGRSNLFLEYLSKEDK